MWYIHYYINILNLVSVSYRLLFTYCTFENSKIVDVETFSFRWTLLFWYFCFLLEDKARLALSSKRKQKYQNGNIYWKLRVPTSERKGKLSNPRGRTARARCMEKIYGNLQNPAQELRAGAMQLFGANQRYSTKFSRILLNLVLKISTLGSISVGLPTAVLLILIFARPILLWPTPQPPGPKLNIW
jgi:hypothetical protein